MPSLEVNSMLGKFLILQLLGKGGMGEVWLAEDTLLKRKVALKTINPLMAQYEKARKRFLREARSAANVEHERIVRVYEIGEVGEVAFISMELLPGQSLEDFLENSPIPSLKFTLEVVRQVCEGLQVAHMHEPSLIHRDIKPANTWLKSSADKKRIDVKLLDFGLARAAEGDSISQNVGGVIGTPSHMSPEQWRGRDLDGRSDLFSVGVMLYQMTTGQCPFRGTSEQISFQVTREEHPPIRELKPTLPESLCQLIDDLLAKEKSRRPATAGEVIRRLEEIRRELPDELTPFVGTAANASARRETRTPPGPINRPPTPTALIVPHRSRLPLIGMLLLSALLGVGVVLLLKGDPKPEVVKADEKLQARLNELEKQVVELNQRPGRTAEDIEEKQRFEAEIKRLRDQLNTKQEPMKEVPKDLPKVEVVKNDPKEPIKVVPKKPEPLDCTGEKGADEATVKRVQKEWADYLGVEVETSVDLGDDVKMEFVLIPPGKFMMGAPASEKESYNNERPVHLVTLTKPFYLGKYEVTQAEYTQLSALPNPSHFKSETTSPRHPVEQFSWNDAKVAWKSSQRRRCRRASAKRACRRSAQWEYACRAGTRTSFYFGEVLNGDKANCDGKFPYGTTTKGKYLEKTCPVDSKEYLPNALGLHQMHGNVWEWCLDGWEEKAYKAGGRTDPLVGYSNNNRILRGGSWYVFSGYCRSADRGASASEYRSYNIGFRLILLP